MFYEPEIEIADQIAEVSEITPTQLIDDLILNVENAPVANVEQKENEQPNVENQSNVQSTSTEIQK